MLRLRAVLRVAGAACLAMLAACGAEDSATETDVSMGVQVLPQMGHSNSVYTVAFSPDGRLAASGGSENTMKLWGVDTGREIRNFTGHTGNVKAVAFSPDGSHLVSGGADGEGPSMRLWDVATGKQLRSFKGPSVTAIAFSPDGRYILSGHWDWRIPLILWDAATGEALRKFVEHPGGISSVAFSPDGRFALSGSMGASQGDPSMKLWDVSTGAELRRFSMESGGIAALAFSPDGRFALSGSTGKDTPSGGIGSTMTLWDLTTGQKLRDYEVDLRRIYSVAFSPDGRLFVASGDGKHSQSTGVSAPSLALWNAATGKRLRGFEGHRGTVSSAVFPRRSLHPLRQLGQNAETLGCV
jgi:WD40 repeat protein